MDGVVAVRQLAIADAALVALVPAARIVAGPLGQGVTLPAISLESISTTYLNIPNPSDVRFVRERVQATVNAASYPSQKAILRALRQAVADTFPTVEGIGGVAVHLDSAGPDFRNDEANIWLSSQDLIVKYSEET